MSEASEVVDEGFVGNTVDFDDFLEMLVRRNTVSIFDI